MFLTTAPFTLRDIVGPASPVEAGIVASLAQPGGNVTGTTNRLGDLGGKVLQLITDCAEAFPNRRSGRLCKPWIHHDLEDGCAQAKRRAHNVGAPVLRLAAGQRLQYPVAPELGRRRRGSRRKGGSMAENEHPKGALLFILVFLVLVVVFWINTYMRLWLRY